MAIHRPVGPSGPFRGWKGRRAGRKEGKRPLKKNKSETAIFPRSVLPERRRKPRRGTGRDGTGLVEEGGGSGGAFFF